MYRHNSIVPEEFKEYTEYQEPSTNQNEPTEIPPRRNRLFLYGCFIFLASIIIIFFLIM